MPTPAKLSSRIEMGVPPPPPSARTGQFSRDVIDLAHAPIGASILFADLDKPWAVQQAAYRYGGKGWIMVRKTEGGFRAWKIAEPKLR